MALLWCDGFDHYGTSPNGGQQQQVKQFVAGQFVLWEPCLYNIQMGDAYQVRPGCDKAASTCKDKFGNFINFGGFPSVPGKDAIMQTPDTRG